MVSLFDVWNLRNAFLQCLLRNPLNAADCHLSIQLIAIFWSGWCHTLFGLGANLFIRPGCHCIYPAWVPHYLGLGAKLFIRPECHITLAWVPIYSFGLSATLPWCGCQFIHSAWVPLYLSGLSATLLIWPGCQFIHKVWQVCHSFPASLPFYPRLGKFANL